MASENVVQINDGEFDSALEKNTLMLVDFWAAWCFPCKMIAPLVEEMAATYKDNLVCAKLNVDENPVTAAKFSITGIPTLILFKEGNPVERIVGAVPKEQLEEKIKAHL